MNVVVIPTGGDINISISVDFHAMEVDSYIYLFDFFESLQIDHRNRFIVIRNPVTTGIGHIQFISGNDHFFGLIPHGTAIHHLHSRRIYLCHIP